MQIRSSTLAVAVSMASFLSKSRHLVGAFSSSPAVRKAAVASTTSRYMSGPDPYPPEQMPFYALGTNLAMQVGGQGNLKTLLDDGEMDIVLEAFCDTLKGTALQDPRTILGKYGPELNKLLQVRTSEIVERVKADGENYIKNFLDCNPEAIQTNSGLVYYEMTPGGGAQPGPTSTVEVHYHGTLTDGTVFDSSVDRGQTISFPLNGVIKGWQEGLAMMKEGGKATLVIPR
jgi:FKBP-type peptidyl-prolyl cis-trans isomerase